MGGRHGKMMGWNVERDAGWMDLIYLSIALGLLLQEHGNCLSPQIVNVS
jgi:hypothetical protein